MSRRGKQGNDQPRVTIHGEVARQIRQHARSNNKTEVCGVLIGNDGGGGLKIDASIAGVNAAQAGTHVTFTQDTWEHIYKIKDTKYPESRIVGWYHSHPGFGVFLSDHDTFIHKNFFSSPLQVAWVYDPHSDEEGCFGWVGSRLERLSEISITDDKGGEGAGETGKPEPVGMQNEGADGSVERSDSRDKSDEDPLWLRLVVTVLSYILVLVVGFVVSWIFFPRRSVFVVDPQTGFVYEPSPDGKRLEYVPELRIPPDALRLPGQPAPAPAGVSPAADPGGSPRNTDASKGSDKKNAKEPSGSKEPHAPRQ